MTLAFLPAVVVTDIPKIYTTLAQFLSCTVYILLFPKRFDKRLIALCMIGFFALFLLLYIGTSAFSWSVWIFMIAGIGIMFLYIFTCCRMTLKDAGYIIARSFILAELAASLEWMLEYFISTLPGVGKWAEIMLPIVYGGIFTLIYFTEKRHFPPLNCDTKSLITSLLMAVVAFSISNMSFISSDTPISGTYPSDIFYMRTLVDACGMLLLYILQEIRFSGNEKTQAAMMQTLLTKQYELYIRSKENMDLINRRCHDLKHQIQVIREETDAQKRLVYLNDIEKDIKNFDYRYNTGSNVLDIILTSKIHSIVENHIQFSCMADGEKLEFMDTMDICSLFGNALDNAIESLIQIEEEEKRLLHFTVSAQNNYLMIKIENYYNHNLIMENGDFHTTKKDKEFHGFGIKSIRSTAEKYGGSATFTAKDNWFTVCILIPVKN